MSERRLLETLASPAVTRAAAQIARPGQPLKAMNSTGIAT